VSVHTTTRNQNLQCTRAEDERITKAGGQKEKEEENQRVAIPFRERMNFHRRQENKGYHKGTPASRFPPFFKEDRLFPRHFHWYRFHHPSRSLSVPCLLCKIAST